MIIGNSNTFTIEMVEGDWGEVLPIELLNETTEDDKFIINIFKNISSSEPLITKSFENIQNNTINFKLTEDESKLLKVGVYFYNIDWYQDDNFYTNIIASKTLKVKNKAGKENEN